MRGIPLSIWWFWWLFVWEFLSPLTFWILILIGDWLVRVLFPCRPASARTRILYGWLGLAVSVLAAFLFDRDSRLVNSTQAPLYWSIVALYFTLLGISSWKLRGRWRAVGVAGAILLYQLCIVRGAAYDRVNTVRVTWRPARISELTGREQATARKPIVVIFQNSPEQGNVVLADTIAERLASKTTEPIEARVYLGYQWGQLTSIYVIELDGTPVTYQQNGETLGWSFGAPSVLPTSWTRLP